MPLLKTVGDQIFWAYSNVGMAEAALRNGADRYSSVHYMIRARLFRDFTAGKIRVSSFYEDERAKIGMTTCCYCGSASDLSLDHIIPRRRLGSDSPENLLPACRRCNSAKGSRDVMVFLRSRGLFPSVLLLRRYLKLIHRYCSENGLLLREPAEAADMDPPFDLSMLDCDAYLSRLKQLRGLSMECCIRLTDSGGPEPPAPREEDFMRDGAAGRRGGKGHGTCAS